ncbi:MAG TPA: hypothetical protein VLE49_08360, partial [Anaerolineales bacterium]|nr:hypothetical protein [Anaerolineales bacterium]
MKHKLLTGLLLLAMSISGCNLSIANGASPSNGTSAPHAWFDAPLPGTVLLPPNPCQIVAHGASPSGIALFELSINGTVATSIPSPDTKNSLVTLTRDCGLSQPGEYLLQMRVQDHAGQWSGFAETNLIIAGSATPSAVPAATEPTATSTSVPTLTPTAALTGGVSIERISTNLVYLGRGDCGPLEVTITARATAPKEIKVVVLFYRFATGNASSEFQDVAMNPVGGDLYQRTLDPTSLLGGSVPFDQATLQYQIVVQQTDGDTTIRTPVMADIAMQACGNISSAPTAAPVC